jgi:hypothetical protein
VTHRIFIYGPFALFALLAATVSLTWWLEARAFSGRLDAMNGRQIMPGVTLHFATKRISGFPFRLDATFKDIDIAVTTPHGPSHWQAQDFVLHRLTYGASRTLFEAAGRERLDWTDKEGRPHAFPFVPGSMHASASEDDGGLVRFDLDIFAIGSPALSADHAQFHVRRDPSNDGVDVFASADGVRLEPALRSVFGDRISTLSLGAELIPEGPLNALRAGKVAWTNAVRSFVRYNGVVQVGRVEIAMNELSAEGHGSLGFDRDTRPRGLIDLSIAHIDKFVAAIRAHGEQNRRGIAAAIAARAGEAGSDEMGHLGIVFTCSDGIAYLGDRPIGTLDTLL